MTILIVDDHDVDRQYLAYLLIQSGYRVFEACDGEQALQVIDDYDSLELDLVIVDILMPTMDGFDFTRHLRSHSKYGHVPVIFYTARYETNECQYLAGACSVAALLIKPLEPEQMLASVAQALSHPPPVRPIPLDFEQAHLRLVGEKLFRLASKQEEGE